MFIIAENLILSTLSKLAGETAGLFLGWKFAANQLFYILSFSSWGWLDMDKTNLGKKIKNTLKQRQFTIDKLSEKCGLAEQYLGNIERGKL